jgi:hypothetical protein
MTTRFYCLWRGRKLFRVLGEGDEIFCGTAEECKRFREIHARKEARAYQASLRTPRRRRPTFRIFRIAPRGVRRAV